MTTTRTAIARATDLAASLGVKTTAKTIQGILAAIRAAKANYAAATAEYQGLKTPPQDLPRILAVLRRKPARLARVPTQARQRKLVGLNVLLEGFDQGRARTRRIDRHAPLLEAVSAAVGRDSIGAVGAVPNGYRGRAEESVTSATRQGGAILVFWGRVEMPHRHFGRGEKKIVPDGSQIMRRRDIKEAIRLPAGWRWGADEGGPFVTTGPGASTYYPTGAELAQAIQSQDWTQIQAQAKAQIAH